MEFEKVGIGRNLYSHWLLIIVSMIIVFFFGIESFKQMTIVACPKIV
jgi:Cu/Ag efflux pump CusA